MRSFEVLRAALLKIQFFWAVTQRLLVNKYEDSILFVHVGNCVLYQTARRNIPESLNLHF